MIPASACSTSLKNFYLLCWQKGNRLGHLNNYLQLFCIQRCTFFFFYTGMLIYHKRMCSFAMNNHIRSKTPPPLDTSKGFVCYQLPINCSFISRSDPVAANIGGETTGEILIFRSTSLVWALYGQECYASSFLNQERTKAGEGHFLN